jgi:glycogen synthase
MQVLVTGDSMFLRRHQPLFDEIGAQHQQFSYLAGDPPPQNKVLHQAGKVLDKLIYWASPDTSSRLHKNAPAFVRKSRRLERQIRQLADRPDYVLHVFGLYAPFWDKFDIPYGMYLDYTMALADQNWRPWAPFKTVEDCSAWLACERVAYEQATHLFTMSRLVQASLIHDYGIAPEKISVVGSFASRHSVYEGDKQFGSQQILFNGSEFTRKGGELVLEAFKLVKQALPESKLVVIGKKLSTPMAGVENPGPIGSLEEMRQLLLGTDLVVAPGRCDPFPSFVIEAMNYGVPCLVSGQDGMPEIVDHGINGLVVDPLTPERIAETIIHLLKDQPALAALSRQARQKVKTELNYRCVAAKILDIMATLPGHQDAVQPSARVAV